MAIENPFAGASMNFQNDQNLTIAKIAPLIRRKKISPVEITEFFLQRISRLQPALNAFITVTADGARKRAKQADREISQGNYRGPLHGIPISLKDLFYTAGIRTTAGSRILRRFVPDKNAFVVDRLLKAGAIVLGKTNLHEFAFGVTSINPHFGPVHNPWDLHRVPGGSSGGSAAAVAAGLCLASLGTDTGGSIRIPSSACGVVGLKPTLGLVSLEGVIPLAFSLDHAGPIGRCVEDAGILLNALTNEDSGLPITNYLRHLRDGIRGLRIGIPKRPFFTRMQKDVRENVLEGCRVFSSLGARTQEVELSGIRDAGRIFADIVVAEAVSFHLNWIQKRPQDYGPDLRERLEKARGQLTEVYLQAQKKRQTLTRDLTEILKKVDVLAIPTLPIAPPLLTEDKIKIGRFQEIVRPLLLRFTPPGNLSGLPAISIPCGFSSHGLPTGLQILGRAFDEATLLRVAYAYEQATPWKGIFPPEENFGGGAEA
jgi:aspartyl-tRNA(Asn)/glutamyl-tRNA(Gln) amidotransferase subunit A